MKAINGVPLEHILDFIYVGEASVGQEELEEFLETGKELQVKGFEAYVSGDPDEQKRYLNENVQKHDNVVNTTEEDVNRDTYENYYSSDVSFKQKDVEKVSMSANSDLDLQVLEMIEKSDGVWKCKVCGKSDSHKIDIKRHAERHLEGMSHACKICNKSFSNRPGLRNHINSIHSELLSCDLCLCLCDIMICCEA